MSDSVEVPTTARRQGILPLIVRLIDGFLNPFEYVGGVGPYFVHFALELHF